MLLALFCLGAIFPALSGATAHADEQDWNSVGDQMIAVIKQIPEQYEAGDQEGVERSIRQAYYEIYQVSGLEAQIDHRLGKERAQEFTAQLLAVRQITRDGAAPADVDQAVGTSLQMLRADIDELIDTPVLSDQWARVATRITDQLTAAKDAYRVGNFDAAANAARDAYLAHYEADGLEKASISYLGQSRVSQLESLFTKLRQDGKAGSVSVADYEATADELSANITEDAAAIDELSSSSELGWSGFFAAFLILLREGAEALLVVAAVVTYAKKAGRKDQLVGIGVGVAGALLVSAGLAVLFTVLTSSATTGLSQELLEGITGLLAVVMLIWVSNWIHTKSNAAKWHDYIEKTAGHSVETGGVFALASVAFLAVLREGAETILFFSPILAGARTGGDYAKIWMGVGAAVVVLAILFLLVWAFGLRLPMAQLFMAMSVLLGVLAVTIVGGAVKEFQDATLVSATQIGGVPQITLLGIYPTVETLLAQLVVAAIVVALGVIQSRKAKANRQSAVAQTSTAHAEI